MNGMFYEIKEKRVKTSSQAKWWLTAAFSAVVITAVFIGFIFWLGVAVRQPEPSNFVDRYPLMREYQQQYYKPPSKPTLSPKLEYPTAEVLKTTIKNKKGRIEIVEVNSEIDDKLEKIASKPVVVTNIPRTTSSVAGGTLSSLEIEIDDTDTGYSVDELESPETQLRSKISKLSSTHIKFDADDAVKRHSKDRISSLDDVAAISGTDGDDNNNSVKKKSEAVLPSWYDPSLQPTGTSKSEPSNHLKPDAVYELPDFSQIKPDLSIFNTKTIPAFTYLKEPLPQFENLPDSSSSSIESSNVDDSYYYQQSLPSGSSTLNITETETNTNDGKENENSFMSFLQKRLNMIQEWLLYGSKNKNRTTELLDVIKAVNNSFQTKNIGHLFSKLKEFYSGFNSSDVQNMPLSNLLYPTSPSILNNSTSLVSFGLLAIDLFLLHNVQQIVWSEETKIGEEMLKDPDVIALNALFMSPDRIQQLRQTNSRILTNHGKKGVVHDLIEFINGGLRAVLNLSKAYKSSTTRSNARSTSTGSTLDCIWTLYCRNLDKTAKLHGPYGFLAKMNRYVFF